MNNLNILKLKIYSQATILYSAALVRSHQKIWLSEVFCKIHGEKIHVPENLEDLRFKEATLRS